LGKEIFMIGSKKPSMFSGVGFMLKLYWKYKKSSLVYLSAYCVLGGALPFAAIIFPKFIVDELTGAQQPGRIVFYVAALLFCTLFGSALINLFDTKCFLKGMLVFNAFQEDMCRGLYEADLQNVEAASFLDLKRKAEMFLYADGKGFGGVLYKFADVTSRLITLLGIISIIAVLNPVIIVIFIALALITAWRNAAAKKEFNSFTLEQSVQERKLMYDQSLFSEYKFAKEIRINTMGDWLLGKYRDRLGILANFYKRRRYTNLKMQIFGDVSSFIQQGVAYGYLVYSVLARHFGIGSFTMYLAAINSFSNAMFSLMDSVVDLRRFSDFYGAVDAYLNMEKRQREGRRLPLSRSADPVIEFRNVSFRYPNQERYTLKNINITIRGGEKLSIVGENGAGKTTFTKLLARFYRPTEGTIYLNGVDIQDYDYDQYADMFSVLFQDFALFVMPLRDNITLGRNIDDRDIVTALEQSGFKDKLDRLEKGLDTPVYKTFDETGFEPSGGEGQKIAMARALLKGAPVVILDEPTAALDPRAEYEMYMRFNGMVQGKTAIFISHRLASVKFCDKVVVFRNGEIAEYGGHDELMKKRGLYHELFTMQAQFYNEADDE
jgi:ATP-binding cassette subfamily B protein/ATP-binding cassette subfamily C protein